MFRMLIGLEFFPALSDRVLPCDGVYGRSAYDRSRDVAQLERTVLFRL